MLEQVLAILNLLEKFFNHFSSLLANVFRKKNVYYSIPKRSIIIAPNPCVHDAWWHMGNEADKPGMQIVGRFNVTNITKYNIVLSAVHMKKPEHLGNVYTKDLKSKYYGTYAIPPGGFTNVTFTFWVIPPFKKEGEQFLVDIAIIDNFGNKHWIKEMEFIYI